MDNQVKEIEFLKSGMPIGLAYFKGDKGTIPSEQADEAIKLGYATDEFEEKEEPPTIDLPAEMPGRKQLLEAKIYTTEQIKEVAENLTDIKGIGEKLAEQILQSIA